MPFLPPTVEQQAEMYWDADPIFDLILKNIAQLKILKNYLPVAANEIRVIIQAEVNAALADMNAKYATWQAAEGQYGVALANYNSALSNYNNALSNYNAAQNAYQAALQAYNNDPTPENETAKNNALAARNNAATQVSGWSSALATATTTKNNARTAANNAEYPYRVAQVKYNELVAKKAVYESMFAEFVALAVPLGKIILSIEAMIAATDALFERQVFLSFLTGIYQNEILAGLVFALGSQIEVFLQAVLDELIQLSTAAYLKEVMEAHIKKTPISVTITWGQQPTQTAQVPSFTFQFSPNFQAQRDFLTRVQGLLDEIAPMIVNDSNLTALRAIFYNGANISELTAVFVALTTKVNKVPHPAITDFNSDMDLLKQDLLDIRTAAGVTELAEFESPGENTSTSESSVTTDVRQFGTRTLQREVGKVLATTPSRDTLFIDFGGRKIRIPADLRYKRGIAIALFLKNISYR